MRSHIQDLLNHLCKCGVGTLRIFVSVKFFIVFLYFFLNRGYVEVSVMCGVADVKWGLFNETKCFRQKCLDGFNVRGLAELRTYPFSYRHPSYGSCLNACK